MNANKTISKRYISGIGFGYSATIGAKVVIIRAIKLQVPIDVALFKNGNIVLSTNEA
jgi:hypothetical protein